MMRNIFFMKKLIILIAVTVICGCSTNPYTGESQVSRTAIGAGTGIAAGAVGGALVGGVIGATAGPFFATVIGGYGAAIGGAVGLVTGTIIGAGMDIHNTGLRKQLLETGVQVKKVDDTLQLIMPADITFDFNSYQLKESFYPVLDSVAIVLNEYDNANIEITGYTDNIGSEEAHNQTLSEQRAKIVGDYLVSRGISASRIATKGFGEHNPVASNLTAEGRALNNRVVLTLNRRIPR
jgi:outer membrane protein OmpA-like peptidoglycan-associated protein